MTLVRTRLPMGEKTWPGLRLSGRVKHRELPPLAVISLSAIAEAANMRQALRRPRCANALSSSATWHTAGDAVANIGL